MPSENFIKKKPNIIATVEARMSSSRLPGKILKKINKFYLLDILIKRVQKSKLINEIIVATTKNKKEKPLIKFLKQKKINFFRGSEKNVNLRLIKAAEKLNADIIVQLTGDNPLVDPKIIDHMINYFIKNQPNVNYLTNCGMGNYKEGSVPIGLNTQIFFLKDLKNNYKFCNKQDLKEHPSLYFYREGSKKYKLKNINLSFIRNKKLIPKLRLTIDTKEDLKLVKIVFKKLYEKKGMYFSLQDILVFFKKNFFLPKSIIL